MDAPSAIHVEPADALQNAIVEHWAKARIDNPLDLVRRLDDGARNIILVSGALEGLLIAVLKVDQPRFLLLSGFSIIASALLLGAVVLAVKALSEQTDQLDAYPIYSVFRSTPPDERLQALDCRVEAWCKEVKQLAKHKRGRIRKAMTFLVAGLAMLVVCLITNTVYATTLSP